MEGNNPNPNEGQAAVLETVKEFADLVGIDESSFNLLIAKEKPEDFDLQKLATNYKDKERKLFENSLDKEGMFKEQTDQKFKIFKETVSTKIAKGLGLNFTRKEAAEIDWEEMLNKANEHMAKQIQAGSESSDEELRNQLKLEQEKSINLKNDYDEYREKIKIELEEKEKNYKSDLKKVHVGLKFNEEFDKVDWGIPKLHIPKWKQELQNEIMENYHVNEDGTLTGKNGAHAESYDGKNIYNHIREPLTFLLDKYQLLKKSYGQPDGEGGASAVVAKNGVFNRAKMSPAAVAMLERIQKRK